MRLAIVAADHAPQQGSDHDRDEFDVRAMAAAFAARGHRVRIYERCTAPGSPASVELDANVWLRAIDAGPQCPLSDDRFRAYIRDFALHLSDDWAEWRPDVVHAHSWRSGAAALHGREGCAVPIVQTPSSWAGTNNGSAGPKLGSSSVLELAMCRSADAVVVRSQEQLLEVLRAGVPRARVTVIPPAVDLTLLHPDGPRFARTGRHRLVATGQMAPNGGFATVIEALARLPPTELIIAGRPLADTTDARAELSRLRVLSERLGVDHRLKIFEALKPDYYPDLLRSADIFVSVPEWERFGVGVVEAMACGRPVVASAVGGHRDTVVDQCTGLLVPSGDVPHLVRALRMLLDNRILLDGYGLAGRERVEMRYSWNKVAEEMEAVYTSTSPIT